MSYLVSTPAALVMWFALGAETVIGAILAAANGLASIHKDILVGFAVAFPVVVLVVLLILLRHKGTVT